MMMRMCEIVCEIGSRTEPCTKNNMEIEITTMWQAALLAPVLLGQTVLAFRRPQEAAAAVLFLLPSYLVRVRVGAVPTNLLELLIVVFVAGRLGALLRGRARVVFSTLSPFQWIGIGLFVFGSTVSAIHGIRLGGYDPELTRTILGSLKGFALTPAIFIVGWLAVQKPQEHVRDPISHTKRVFRAYVASAVAVAVIALLGAAFFESFITFDSRLRGFYLSPNHLAMYIAPAAVLILGLGGSRRVRWGVFALLLGAVVFTQSLGALLAIGAGLGSMGVFVQFVRDRISHNKGRKVSVSVCEIGSRTAAVLIMGIVVAAGIAAPFLMGGLADTLLDAGSRSSFASRVMIWQTAGEMLKKHWVLGIGPGAFQHHYLELQEKFPPYLEWAVPQPHNLIVSFWLQAGALGLVGMMLLFFARARRNFQTAFRCAAFAALIVMLIHGIVDTPFWKNDLSILLFSFLFTARS